MSLLVIRSALDFFFPCPVAKFHEDTSCKLDASSEFFVSCGVDKAIPTPGICYAFTHIYLQPYWGNKLFFLTVL